jgi:hypothetical protein
MLWTTRHILLTFLCFCFILQADTVLAQSNEDRGSAATLFGSLDQSTDLKFVPNRGQLSDQNGQAMPEVLYTLDGYGMKTYFTKGSMHYVFSKLERTPLHTKERGRGEVNPHDTLSLYRIDVKFLGSNPNAEILASDETDDYTNFYLTNCPDGITHVPGFRKILYKNIYPNIDLALYTSGERGNRATTEGAQSLEYDFVVHPGGDPSAIRMSYEHASSLSVDEDGVFHLASPFGNVLETKPKGYQIAEKTNENVPCGFKLNEHTVSFKTGTYDRTRDLYIDPQRVWGTYYGWADTANETDLQALAPDRSGNVDITGSTDATANIATSGSFETAYGGGNSDCYIAKFGPTGTLLWATYYGGSGDDYSRGIACDSAKGMVIVGFTTSTNVIASSGSFESTFGPGIQDAFLASFDSTGARRWGTYIRGVGWTRANPDPHAVIVVNKGDAQGTDVAIDSAQNIIVVGDATDSGIATLGAQKYLNDQLAPDAFIAKFTSSGTLSWATYFGGNSTIDTSKPEGNAEVSTDAGNNIYMSGTTASDSGIATNSAYQKTPGPGYISKWSSSGALDWATYYLDSAGSTLYNIAASRAGTIYVVASGQDIGIATPGAYQTTRGGGGDGIMAKFSTAGKPIWATYYGGDSVDELYDLVLDSSENIFASGYTHSASGISTTGEYQPTLLGPYNAFMVKFDSGCHRRWGTYYGRRGYGVAIAIDRQGHPFLGGYTETATGEYATPGAHDSVPVGHWNAFLAKFCDPLEMSITSNTPDTVCPNTTVSLSTKSGLASYQWLLNGNTISGANSNPYTFLPSAIPRGYYTVNGIGTDLCSTVSDTFLLVVRPVPQIGIPASSYMCPGSSIKLLATISGWNGPLKYAWTPAASLDHPDSLQPTATPTQPTTYTLAVTDSNGCVTTQKLIVSFYAQPKIALPGNQTVCSGSPITIAASATGGMPGYTYAWSPSAGLDRTDTSTVIATVTKNTTYTVTVSDTHGCTSKDSLLLVVTLAPKIAVSSPLSVCKGSSISLGGSVSGGTRPYTYLWTPAGSLSDSAILAPTASPDSTTLYTITVTDKNGCSAVDSVLVTVSDSLTPAITADGSLTICTGDTVHLSAGTGYASYAWSDGETTSDISVTRSGNYTVHVTGGAGCAGTSSPVHVTVLPDSVPRPILTTTQTTICAGEKVQVQTSETYASYLWSTGDTTPTIFVSSTDTVTVTATNAAACSGTSAPLIVTVLPTPVATVTASGPDTLCGSNSLTLSAASGYAHYDWSSGDTTSSIVVKTSGIYSVTITNSGGCSATSVPATVTVNPTPDLFISGPAAVCPNATATYADSSNTRNAGDLFAWSLTPTGVGTLSINSPSSITVQWGAVGTAILILTEATPSGCSTTDSFKVTISSNLTPVITPSEPIAFCPGDSVTLDAGAGYASYQWSMNGTQIADATSERLTVNQSGAYTVFVTSAGGCSGTSVATNVTIYPTPATPVITQNGSQLTSSPASQYQWYFNGSPLLDSVHQTISPDTTGSYAVTITDSNGCESTSLPYSYSDTVVLRATVSIGGALGTPGTTVSIPLVLDSGTNLPRSGATTYNASITLDGKMLKPINPVGVPAGNNWTVAVSGNTPNTPGVLQTITALALDSELCSEMTIDTFYFTGASIAVTTISGLFCDSGTCSPVLASGDPAFMIEKVYPNPSESSFSLLYHITQDGPVSISLQDYLGRTVSVLKDAWTVAGDENETYSTQAISSGVYRLVLRSGANAASMVLVIQK